MLKLLSMNPTLFRILAKENKHGLSLFLRVDVRRTGHVHPIL